MGISQHLRRKLQEALGAEAAADLVSQIEDMSTLRGDLGELRHEMQLGFSRVDARFEKLEATLDARFASIDSKFEGKFTALSDKFAASEGKLHAVFEKGLREQTRFFFLAWSVLLAAIVGLYAR